MPRRPPPKPARHPKAKAKPKAKVAPKAGKAKVAKVAKPKRARVIKHVSGPINAKGTAEQVNLLQEELQAALGELARIASDENSARRDLEAQISAARTREDALRRELEAVRMDLRVALADLEIARSRTAS